MADRHRTEPLGVAVIGYSFMGKAHSNAWRNVGAFYPETPAVRQQVIVGRSETEVGQAARQHGWAESATDWRSIVTRDDVDIVDVCTPGHLHAEVAIAALEAGKHVLVEKPLANSVEESERMITAATAARSDGVQSMVGFNYRRVPALALARSLISEGRLGRVRQVRAAYLQDWLADENAPMTWRLRRESAGSGVLGDLGSHVVDQLRYLLGDEIVAANGDLRTFVPRRRGDNGLEDVTVDDAAWATLHTAAGVVASVELSRMAFGRRNGLVVEVYGSEGSLAFDLEALNELYVDDGTGAGGSGRRRILITDPGHPYVESWWPPGHTLGWDSTFTSQAADFLTAIAADRGPEPSFEDGLAVQKVLAAIQESAADSGTRKEIR